MYRYPRDQGVGLSDKGSSGKGQSNLTKIPKQGDSAHRSAFDVRDKSKQFFNGPSWKPTWCHLLFYFTSYALNMFRTLIYPSSGACDYSVELPHWSCVLGSMCVGVSVWLGWSGIRVAIMHGPINIRFTLLVRLDLCLGRRNECNVRLLLSTFCHYIYCLTFHIIPHIYTPIRLIFHPFLKTSRQYLLQANAWSVVEKK